MIIQTQAVFLTCQACGCLYFSDDGICGTCTTKGRTMATAQIVDAVLDLLDEAVLPLTTKSRQCLLDDLVDCLIHRRDDPIGYYGKAKAARKRKRSKKH